MEFYNKVSKRFNKLSTAKRNGLYENPENFVLPVGYGINKKTRRVVLSTTLIKQLNKQQITTSDIYIQGKIYNAQTKRFIKDTPRNIRKIQQQVQPLTEEQIRQTKLNETNKMIEEQMNNNRGIMRKITYDDMTKTSRDPTLPNIYIHWQDAERVYNTFGDNYKYEQVLEFYYNGELQNEIIINNINFNEEASQNDIRYEVPRIREFKTKKYEFNKYNNNVRKDMESFEFMIGSGNWIIKKYFEFIYGEEFDENIDEKDYHFITLRTTAIPRIENINIEDADNQEYMENESNTCVYDGLIDFFSQKMDKDKNCTRYYNKLVDNYDKYAKSYNDKNIHEIAQLVNSSIRIYDVINNNHKTFNENALNHYKIDFINTRYNHLNVYYCSQLEPSVIEKEEYNNIKDESDFYIERFGKLYTQDNIYSTVKSDYYLTFSTWAEINNFENYYIKSNSNEYKFITELYDYNPHVLINDTYEIKDELYSELDLNKAYFNYSCEHYNKYYRGVPSGSFTMTKCNDTFDYLKLDKGLVGYFQVEITYINPNYEQHFDKLGLKLNSIHLFFTSTIDLLIKYGTGLLFINACYSPSVHIPFDDEFLNKEDDVSYYCKAVGNMFHDNMEIKTVIKPLEDDTKFYSTMINKKSNHKYSFYKYLDEEKKDILIHMITENEAPKTYIHIAYAINAYTKTLILDKILNMNINDILAVKLDSIVFKKDTNVDYDNYIFKLEAKSKVERLFTKQEQIDNSNKPKVNNPLDEGIETTDDALNRFNTYNKQFLFQAKYNMHDIQHDIHFNDVFTTAQGGQHIYKRVVQIYGKGGSGKTHNLLSLNNFNKSNICFSANSWNLIQKQKEKHPEIIGLSIPKLLGHMENGEKSEKHKLKSLRIIVLDEATMITEKTIDEIIKTYYWCYIFILGDINPDGTYYQCSLTTSLIKNRTDVQYIEYKKTFRFEPELNDRLNDLRYWMDKLNNPYKLFAYFKKAWADRIYKKEDIQFNDNDVGISACNDLGKYSSNLSQYFYDKGTNPQYYIKQTIYNKGQLKGQRINGEPTHKNYISTLFRTIHSMQGCEVENDQQLIIYIDGIFDYNLFYTALSRAKKISQIHIIISDKLV